MRKTWIARRTSSASSRVRVIVTPSAAVSAIATSPFSPCILIGRRILIGLYALCLLSVFILATSATAAIKPYQWTTAQASSALMRQSEDFYEVDETTRQLTKAVCRGKGKAVQRRFLAFACTATVSDSISEGTVNLRVSAKTRKAGGLCWAVAPATIPSGCLAPGKRLEGSADAAWSAAYKVINDRYVQNGRCLPHGSGFFSCSWRDAQGEHRGTVIFTTTPVVKVLS